MRAEHIELTYHGAVDFAYRQGSMSKFFYEQRLRLELLSTDMRDFQSNYQTIPLFDSNGNCHAAFVCKIKDIKR